MIMRNQRCDTQPIKNFFFEKKYRDALKPRDLNCEVAKEHCIFLAELMGDWLTTFLISRSFLLLEILGQPDFFAVLKSIFVLKFFDDVVYSDLGNLHLPSYFTFRELHCAKIDHLNAFFSADCCFLPIFQVPKFRIFSDN